MGTKATPLQAFNAWAGLKPKGGPAHMDLMEEYIKRQMRLRDALSAHAATASERADWAWREFCKMREEALALAKEEG